jgi:hypothetical protein
VLDALNVDPPAVIKGVTQSLDQGVSFEHTFDHPTPPPTTPRSRSPTTGLRAW